VTLDVGADPTVARRLVGALPFALTLPFLGLGYWFVAEAHPATEVGFGRLLAVHGAAAVIGSAAWIVIGAGALTLLGGPAGLDAGDVLGRNRVLLATVGLSAYAVVVLVYYLLIALGERQREQLRQEELLTLAKEAELQALKFQVNPHFLFNSLNSISALTTAAPDRARDMCVRLGDFLRRTLRLGDRRAVRLSEELELVNDYLSLEQIRFGDRIDVAREGEAPCLDVPVPPLILQPLVENAVKHGVASLLDGMELRIEARRDERAGGGDVLRVTVANTYDPEGVAGSEGTGLGLANTADRLERFCGERHRLEVERGEREFRVTMTLPWRSRR